jgi:metal-responsive CopG/Arc/MetJ family transcriptional regulator
MMGKTAKLTISVPEELILFTDEIAREKKISRSKVVASFLQELAEKHKDAEMAEGYKAMAKENKKIADLAAGIEQEVILEWKQAGHGH